MRIIPVIDLKAGIVVRGLGGRREEYRPIESVLTERTTALEMARAFRVHFGLNEIYLADLDSIAGEPPAGDVYADLLADGFSLLADSGVREQSLAIALARAGVQCIVVGLETLLGPDYLPEIIGALGAGRIVFSLDLKNGEPLGNREAWGRAGPLQIVKEAVGMGVRRLIVMDLAAVGSGTGTRTEALCRLIRERHPHLELIAGGGVRGVEDLQRLGDCGVNAVLVATALHDGRIAPDVLSESGYLTSHRW
jgi:phosphoribosylformimino-5-aminoimidazole carboxamide ribotide isomerase